MTYKARIISKVLNLGLHIIHISLKNSFLLATLVLFELK